uniref:Olfactory receptor n=1 Tax=Callorhinus ursinus TaxID=34884 RepID=A0A3Q7NIY8_CALUR|nr:olfactory receptor-like protein OLF4 [Callorhinus ursinus]
MGPGNDTQISKFLLLGFSEEPQLQPLIFGLFLSMYLITVFGNLLIVLAVGSDSHLHMPMYFLSNLSFVDICFTSTTIPKMLMNIQTESKVIMYAGCVTQIYFFILFAVLDVFLLSVMAYDRFGHLSPPALHDHHEPWALWTAGSGVLGHVYPEFLITKFNAVVVCLLYTLPDPPLFFEFHQMIQLACSDTFLNNLVMYFAAVLLGGGPFAGILYSYSKIVSSILGISSAQGKYTAFSTCASHLSVVPLFYCTSLGVYLSSAAPKSSHSSAVASVMYMVVTPMLNPFIYSPRNRDIKRALKGIIGVPVMRGPILLGQKKCP